jgi:hypothetical protein
MMKRAWNIYHSSNGVKGMYVLGVVTLNIVKERRNMKDNVLDADI